MLDQINAESVLFLDVETVPQYPDYKGLPVHMRALWDRKATYIKVNETDTPEQLYPKAGIYAEFGKIVCISCGFLRQGTFRVKSFFGHEEKTVLEGFAALLNDHFNRDHHMLCAHNGKEFDYPYIARRMIINGVRIPSILDIAGRKPWEVRHLDTMELWKFGDWKNYTSLDLLATILGIETPKGDMDGSMVAGVYWNDNDLQKIVAYCEKDTATVARIFMKYKGIEPFGNENIISSGQ